jgi:hypothetical protein
MRSGPSCRSARWPGQTPAARPGLAAGIRGILTVRTGLVSPLKCGRGQAPDDSAVVTPTGKRGSCSRLRALSLGTKSGSAPREGGEAAEAA